MLTVPWWVWLIAGAVLALAEMHMPGGYLIWIAAGAVVTAIASGLWPGRIEAQLGIFVVASALSCIGGYYAYRGRWRVASADAMLNERIATLVGARGVISEAIVNGVGKVRVGDSVWLAEGPDMPAGMLVRVHSVAGMRVRVERAEPQLDSR